MEVESFMLALFMVLMALILNQSSAQNKYYVGGDDGWVRHPNESYVVWAQKYKFKVDDTLIFRYKNGTDSVLVVDHRDYGPCNTSRPMVKMDDGYSVFKCFMDGCYYFISGNKESCMDGEKLMLVVTVDDGPKIPFCWFLLAPSPSPSPAPSPFPLLSPTGAPLSSPLPSPLPSPTGAPLSSPSPASQPAPQTQLTHEDGVIPLTSSASSSPMVRKDAIFVGLLAFLLLSAWRWNWTSDCDLN